MLEIAAGTGRNLRHYPPTVRLTTMELSPEMLEIARREAASLGRDVDLRVGDAQALEFPDDSFAARARRSPLRAIRAGERPPEPIMLRFGWCASGIVAVSRAVFAWWCGRLMRACRRCA